MKNKHNKDAKKVHTGFLKIVWNQNNHKLKIVPVWLHM